MSLNNRKFNTTDGRLIEHGNSVVSFLPEDLEDFKAFDSTFGQPFVDQLKAGIDAVNQIKSDDVAVDEQTQLTDQVRESMEKCNEAFKTVAFFTRKAFDGNESIQNQLGFNDIAEARSSQLKMIDFMGSFAKTAARYKDQLTQAGMNPRVIDSLPELHQELTEANNEQEMYKKERPSLTYERVERLNKVYDMLLYVSDMAKIIYADNPPKLIRYKMPTPRTSTDSEDDLITS
jgi:hypothetical protein